MSALNAVIGPELIAQAEQADACSDALAWLRAEPRTWRELRAQDAGWLAWGIAHGLADSVLPEMVADSDAIVRRCVARWIDPAHLPGMVADPDAHVRWHVARRIDPASLAAMMQDQDAIVRWYVAGRIAPEHLPEMMRDSDPYVRCRVAARIDPARLPDLMQDPNASVRWNVADRARSCRVMGNPDRHPSVDLPFLGKKLPDGRALCCRCGAPVSGRRRSWCGDDCVERYLIARGDQKAARRWLWARERGVCRVCGTDTTETPEAREFLCVYPNGPAGRWEADHTVPIVEGGALSPENLRTLCVPCHRSETASLRRRLARRKKNKPGCTTTADARR